jgi:hypothetical protein
MECHFADFLHFRKMTILRKGLFLSLSLSNRSFSLPSYFFDFLSFSIEFSSLCSVHKLNMMSKRLGTTNPDFSMILLTRRKGKHFQSIQRISHEYFKFCDAFWTCGTLRESPRWQSSPFASFYSPKTFPFLSFC